MAKKFKQSLNDANPNQLADLLRDLKLGDLIKGLPTQLTKQAPVAGAASNGNLTTLDVIHLPDDAKAAFIHRASVRAGGATGEFTPQAYATTPATTQVAVTPNGDIAFLHAGDLVTDVDVTYRPAKGEVVEFDAVVATGVATIPAALVARGVLMLLSASLTAGAVTGDKIILAPVAGTGLPATTKAQLTSNKSTVSFNNATDAGTKCHCKVLVAPAVNPATKLDETASY